MDGIGWYCYNNTIGLTRSDYIKEPYEKGTHEVGRRAPNRLDIYDMSGNVQEWCYDKRDNISNSESVTNPIGSELLEFTEINPQEFSEKNQF